MAEQRPPEHGKVRPLRPADLPHDLEAERMTLGAFFFDGRETWTAIGDSFDPTEFFSFGHQNIAKAIAKACTSGLRVEPPLVRCELAQAGLDGVDLVDEIAKHASAANVTYYWNTVRKLAEARRLRLKQRVIETTTGVESGAIKLVRASEVLEEPVQWLIPGFVAKSELHDLSGDPGVGKGHIFASWSAHITNSSDATVLLFGTEDRLGHVKARLRAERADLKRVFLLDIREAGTSPVLPANVDHVEAIVRQTKAALVAFDPALEFMEPELDAHRQQDVQRFAASLGGIAQRTGAGVFTVRHLNKAQNTAAIYRAAGSIAFVGRARVAMLAAKDKEGGKRVLSVYKGNVGKDSVSVEYDIIERDGATCIAWGEPTTVTADELVNQEPKKRRGPPAAKVEAACDVLRSMLANGPMKVDDVLRCAKAEGIGRSTVYEAAKVLKLDKVTLNLRSAWRLPPNASQEANHAE